MGKLNGIKELREKKEINAAEMGKSRSEDNAMPWKYGVRGFR